MSKWTRIIICVVVTIVFAFGLFTYFSFAGTPWQKLYHKAKIKEYLNQKYSEEMIIKKSTYNFKDGKYGVIAYPRERPELEFRAMQHYLPQKKYTDYYPEVLWEHQVNADYKEKIAQIYPQAERMGFYGVMGESDGVVIGGKVPHYTEIKPFFHLSVNIPEKLSVANQEEEMKKLFTVICLINENSLNSEILIAYQDKKDDTKNALKFVSLNQDEVKRIKDVKDLQSVFTEAVINRF